MANVTARRDKNTGELESVESLIRRFKKQVLNDGVMEECKKREYFVPKALKRKLKSKAAERRNRLRAIKIKKDEE